jgi:hypothetical protein
MNRRRFFSFLGIGAAAAVVAPKTLTAEPMKSPVVDKIIYYRQHGWNAAHMTEKIFSDRVKKVLDSFQGRISPSQAALIRLRMQFTFLRKA